MPKLITVQFAIPDDDPAASLAGMVDEMQNIYDHHGIAGSFVVQRVEEYLNDPAMFAFDPDAQHDPLPLLKESCVTHSAFYTPEDKNQMDTWMKAQSSTMPTGIAVMVGFNYAMRQVQRILNGEIKKEQDNAG